ncbi:hypothetical protein BCV72DRAFT_201768, partial [Rhizopus microsporus var. microsporus]
CVRQVPRIDPTAYNPGIVVEYLVQNKQFSYQHLNGIRSAIASVFQVLHSDKPSLTSHERILQFFQAKRRIDPKFPNYTKEVYSLTPIIDMIRSWGPTKGLRLKRLQEKTVLLLAMVTMWRPRSDLGRLQYEGVQFEMDNEQKIAGVTLLAKNSKKITPKQSKF